MKDFKRTTRKVFSKSHSDTDPHEWCSYLRVSMPAFLAAAASRASIVFVSE